MLWTCIAIVLSISFSVWGEFLSHMALTDRPILLGAFVGLLLGDVKTGILVGAQMELALLGVVGIGASRAADSVSSTIMTVAFVIIDKLPMETVIPLGVTIGYVVNVLSSGRLLIAEFFVPGVDRALAEDNQKKFKANIWAGTILGDIVYPSVICITGYLIGGSVLEAAVNNLPQFVLSGISAAGGMLSGLGIAMILALILSKDVTIYFMAGFVIYKYLEVDMVFMLIIGLLLAFLAFTSDRKKVVASAAAVSEEEEFLS